MFFHVSHGVHVTVEPLSVSKPMLLVVPTIIFPVAPNAIAVTVPVVPVMTGAEVQTKEPVAEYFLTTVPDATKMFPDESINVSATEAVGAPAVTTALFQVVSLPPAVFALAGESCELTV